MDGVGKWGYIMSALSFTKIAELGLGAAMIRFVAKYNSMGERRSIVSLVQTALYSISFILLLLSFTLYRQSEKILTLIKMPIDPEILTVFLVAIPSFALMVISMILIGVLDGLSLNYKRSIVSVFGQCSFLLLTYFLIEGYGLVGAAYAQLVQYMLVVAALYFIFICHLKVKPAELMHFSFEALSEIKAVFLKLNLSLLIAMIFEPVIKFMLNLFGGMNSVGIYELSNKVVMFSRNIVIESQKFYTAKFATSINSSDLLQISYRNSLIFGCLSMVGLIVLMPVIFPMWLGSFEYKLFIYTAILGSGWLINIFAAPVFFRILGSGDVMKNVFFQAQLLILSIISCSILGSIFGDIAFIIGLSFAIGFTSYYYIISEKENIGKLIPDDLRSIFIFNAFFLVSFSVAVLGRLESTYLIFWSIIGLLFLVVTMKKYLQEVV